MIVLCRLNIAFMIAFPMALRQNAYSFNVVFARYLSDAMPLT